jgi:cobalt/nickel transport system permease protein
MANVHMLIGIGEGLVTGLVVMAVLRTRPQLVLGGGDQPPEDVLGVISYGLLMAAGLAVFVAPFACSWPDGLDSVAKTLGFSTHAIAASVHSPMPEYRLPFIGSPTFATAVAGLVGTILAFVAAYALARMLVPSLSAPKKDASGPK